jgi:hypothetical protein
MRERISPTARMHLALTRRAAGPEDDVLHDYVRAGLSGDLLRLIERRIASDAREADALTRLDEALRRLNSKMSRALDPSIAESDDD